MSRSSKSNLIVRDDGIELLLCFAQSGNVVKNDFCFLVLLRSFCNSYLDGVDNSQRTVTVIDYLYGFIYARDHDSGHICAVIAIDGCRTAAPDKQSAFDRLSGYPDKRSLAVSVSAANTVNRKATDFRDFDRTAWYAEAVSAAVDNGLLYGKSSTIIDPNGDMTRAEMAAIINRSFGCYKSADISQYKDVSKNKWHYKDVALAVQMGTYNGRSSSSMAPDSPITRQEAMTVVARALELDYDSYSKTDLSAFSDRSEISNWALPYVRAMVGADYIHGRGKILAPLDNITRAEFAQIFHNIIGTYIVSKGTYDKDIKGSVLIRTDDVTFKNMTVDGDLIIGCGAADGKIVLDNVTV